MKVIITIPAYNEEKTLGSTISEIHAVMDKTKYDYLIHVQNDGSTDGTEKTAKKYGAIVNSNPYNLGLAKTFQEEIKNCLALKADIIIHTDADGQYDPAAIPSMINMIKDGHDLVIGSRFLRKNRYKGKILNNLGNLLFSFTLSSLLKIKVTDVTSGFRAFNRKVAENIVIINDFTYTHEQIIKSVKCRFKIGEVPIKARSTRKSRLFSNPLDYAIKAWLNILRIQRDYNPIKFFGITGLMLFGVGFVLAMYFLYLHFFGPGIIGHLGLIMLMLLCITSGMQIMLFGFLADMMRK